MPARLSRRAKELRGTFRPDREAANPPQVETGKVPRPPRSLSRAERATWCELAPQVELLRVYGPHCFTSFKLLVRVVTLAENIPADMPASAAVRLIQTASSLLQRFGLDPVSSERVEALPEPADDEVEEFLFRDAAGARP